MEWTWKTGKQLLYLTIPEWWELGVTIGFSTRGGGESKEPFSSLNLALHVNDNVIDVLRNRSLYLQEFEIDSESCVTAEQVHGTKIETVTIKDKGRGMRDMATAFPKCDGFLTQSNVGLLCFFADCVPIYFFNPKLGIVGLVHAGWKGAANRIAAEAINEIRLAGGSVQDTLVAIGPCIKECCYEVDENVASVFKNYTNSLLHKKLDKYMLNLSEANKEILMSEDVPRANIIVANSCTSCNPHLFYSYRRDGITRCT